MLFLFVETTIPTPFFVVFIRSSFFNPITLSCEMAYPLYSSRLFLLILMLFSLSVQIYA